MKMKWPLPSWRDYPESRLFSLDILRGIDMLLLTVIAPLFMAADKAWQLPAPVIAQFRHVWGVFALYDVIMPCFIFMCGAAIPYALGRRMKDGRPTREFWTHILTRFAMLYVLGSLVQCHLLSLDPMNIHVFYNTLQVIGVAYVTTALVMLIPSRAVQVAIPIVLAVGMGLIVHLCGHGDYTKEGNFAYVFDRRVWGLFLPAGQRSLQPNGYYCYLLPQLACCAITMCGYECARVLKGTLGAWRKAVTLFALAGGLFLAAWLVSFKVPVIKHIYSLSFTLYATAWSVFALATLFVVTDIWKFRRGTSLMILFGQHALAAYLLNSLFGRGIQGLAEHFAQGLPNILGKTAQPFSQACVRAAILIAVLALWNSRKKVKELKG